MTFHKKKKRIPGTLRKRAKTRKKGERESPVCEEGLMKGSRGFSPRDKKIKSSSSHSKRGEVAAAWERRVRDGLEEFAGGEDKLKSGVG